MGPVPACKGKPQFFDVGSQVCILENPYMPAGYLVISGAQFPAYPFGPRAGDADGELAARFQYTVYFIEGGAIISDMFEHFGTYDRIEGVICKGKC